MSVDRLALLSVIITMQSQTQYALLIMFITAEESYGKLPRDCRTPFAQS